MYLEKKVNTLPNKPGCYIYLDQKNRIIYVGKAKDLKKRVSSYFNKVLNIKTTKLVREITDLNIIITKNEREALLLEQNLIKQHKPKYNIVLNDDKNYPYIVITNEKDPQYLYVRKYSNKYKKTYGPLPDGSSAIKLLKMLERIYPLRRCKNKNKPCIHYHINQCSGSCVKEVDPNYYLDMIKKIDDFFNKNSEEVNEMLVNKMKQAADNLQFEEAQRIKESINHIEMALFKQDVELDNKDNMDVFNYCVIENRVCFNVLFYLNGRLSFRDEEIFDIDSQYIEDLFRTYIIQIYSKNIIPDRILIPDNLDLLDLKEYFECEISFANNEEPSLKLAYKNAKNSLEISMINSSSFKSKQTIILEELQELLKMKNFPYHIEVFDVANILNEFVTGAMVVFKNGLPSRNDFRKYNLSKENKDDYHRMEEMINRRYEKDVSNIKNLPDLIIMDGGVIQVNACLNQLDKLGLYIPVIGLVKDDHHKTNKILNLNKEEIFIDKTSSLFNLLSNFQERVHNFAISAFRNKQHKIIKKNYLENIKGVGTIIANKILKAFPNPDDIKNVELVELNKIVKNETISIRILEYFKERKK